MESILLASLLFGLLSAFSLPLGTLTSAIWKPSDRWIAFLMSFGGGALLAALTIDLAAPSVERGDTVSLAIGCVVGGLLFVFLDQLVSQRGGFLRKFSSTIYYFRKKERERFRDLARKIRRVEALGRLGADDASLLAASVSSATFREGSTIFREGDPADCIFLIEEGEVDLLDPFDKNHTLVTMKRGDAFGFMACFTRSEHATTAMATSECQVMRIPYEAIEELLRASWEFEERLSHFLESERVETYLVERQKLTREETHEWVGEALESLDAGEGLPERVAEGDHEDDGHDPKIAQLKSMPFLAALPEDVLANVASHCFVKYHRSGHTFFHAGEPAERFYLVREGSISIMNPSTRVREHIEATKNETFGAFSFLTGQRHSSNAVATTDCSVLVLLRHDFERLCLESPLFAEAIRGFVEEGVLSEYLRRCHNFTEDKALSWVRRAVNNLSSGKMIPSASSMTHEISQHHGAPIAIWLGILLDGIPESFVIGASVAKDGAVSISLIAGLFLANFPESLSSSVGMRQQGMPFGKVFLMWTSLMLLTGAGAALGSIFFQGVPHHVHALVEGVAAGAMLTMIAQTMLPEAFIKGGTITGFSTLLGFLSAILFKSFETGS